MSMPSEGSNRPERGSSVGCPTPRRCGNGPGASRIGVGPLQPQSSARFRMGPSGINASWIAIGPTQCAAWTSRTRSSTSRRAGGLRRRHRQARRVAPQPAADPPVAEPRPALSPSAPPSPPRVVDGRPTAAQPWRRPSSRSRQRQSLPARTQGHPLTVACLAGKIGTNLASGHQEAPDKLSVATEAENGRFGGKRATPDLILGMEEVRGSIPLRSTRMVT